MPTIFGGRSRLSSSGTTIDAAGLEHGRLGQIDLVQLEISQLHRDRGMGAGQEARADAIGDGAEAEIEARGLELFRAERKAQRQAARLDQAADRLRRKNAGGEHCGHRREGVYHRPRVNDPPLDANPFRGLSTRPW